MHAGAALCRTSQFEQFEMFCHPRLHAHGCLGAAPASQLRCNPLPRSRNLLVADPEGRDYANRPHMGCHDPKPVRSCKRMPARLPAVHSDSPQGVLQGAAEAHIVTLIAEGEEPEWGCDAVWQGGEANLDDCNAVFAIMYKIGDTSPPFIDAFFDTASDTYVDDGNVRDPILSIGLRCSGRGDAHASLPCPCIALLATVHIDAARRRFCLIAVSYHLHGHAASAMRLSTVLKRARMSASAQAAPCMCSDVPAPSVLAASPCTTASPRLCVSVHFQGRAHVCRRTQSRTPTASTLPACCPRTRATTRTVAPLCAPCPCASLPACLRACTQQDIVRVVDVMLQCWTLIAADTCVKSRHNSRTACHWQRVLHS